MLTRWARPEVAAEDVLWVPPGEGATAGLGVLAHPMGTATQGLSVSYPAKTLRHAVQSSVCKDALLSVNSNRENLKIPKGA